MTQLMTFSLLILSDAARGTFLASGAQRGHNCCAYHLQSANSHLFLGVQQYVLFAAWVYSSFALRFVRPTQVLNYKPQVS
jgi:hypothetical protein